MEIEDIQNKITDLAAKDQFDWVGFYTHSLITSEDLSDTREFLDFLTNKLQAQGPQLETANPAMYDQYEKYWVQLVIKCLPALESTDRDSFLQQRLLFAVQQGCDLETLYNDFFTVYGRISETQNIVRSMNKALEQNTETLGSGSIEIDGRKLLPQIKYWLLDYSRFPSNMARRGSVERLNYINKSPNTRSLTQVQRQQLLEIMRFYDDVLIAAYPPQKPVSEEDNFPTSQARSTGTLPPQQPGMTVPLPPQAARTQPSIDIQKKLDELKQRTSR